MIALDTVCEGGVTPICSNGNIDDPQFKWLEGELKEATAADQLAILFSHHAIPSLNARVPDEAAPACSTADEHGHDKDPGCDVDPRASTPLHLGTPTEKGAGDPEGKVVLGEDMVTLLHRFPNVIAWVAGHSHVNDVTPYPAPGGGFWSIRVAAEADWPQQSRLLQVFDNGDGTLSLFGTILDHVGGVAAPAPGTAAAGLTPTDLASIGRTLSYNDDQTGARACKANPCGEGLADDRNVELLIDDPRPERRTGSPEVPASRQPGRRRWSKPAGDPAGRDPALHPPADQGEEVQEGLPQGQGQERQDQVREEEEGEKREGQDGQVAPPPAPMPR